MAIAGLSALLLLAALLVIVRQRPELGARGADVLRQIAGDRAVASLEMLVFQLQDHYQQWKYRAGLSVSTAPWQVTPAARPTSLATAIPQVKEIPTPLGSAAASAVRPTATATPQPASEARTPTLTLLASPTPTAWLPIDLPPLGTLQDEGVWSAYIQDHNGNTVAYRTFLQPDPKRPFAFVAVVAFDLAHTRLHYVLGYEEPFSPTGVKRSGAMPAEDKAPGLLLAMFNGGFKATHGEFGAMADGIVALPPRDGIGTLLIYKDGRVKIEVWGVGVQPLDNLIAWRQNGPPVVQEGQINPVIYNNSPKDWGYTVNDVSPTLRSGIGLSADGETLYYFAGPSLSMEALASGMVAAGAWWALQLDINNYWVNFVVVRASDKQLLLEPLLPELMKDNIDRYLYPYGRDFFYVTSRP